MRHVPSVLKIKLSDVKDLPLQCCGPWTGTEGHKCHVSSVGTAGAPPIYPPSRSAFQRSPVASLLLEITIWAPPREDYGQLEKTANQHPPSPCCYPPSTHLHFHFHIRFPFSARPCLSPPCFFFSSPSLDCNDSLLATPIQQFTYTEGSYYHCSKINATDRWISCTPNGIYQYCTG